MALGSVTGRPAPLGSPIAAGAGYNAGRITALGVNAVAQEEMAVGGIVLCGGRSRRIGRPKQSLPFGSESMLERTVRIVSDVVRPVVVVAAPKQNLPRLPDEVVIARDEQEGLGPLAGLAVGLSVLREQDVGAAYASSCDVPLLSPRFIRRMIELLSGHQMVICRDGRHYHPLAAVYRTDLEETIRRLLAAGRRRPVFLLDECDARVVDAGQMREVDADLDSLQNINTPEEYEAALRRYRALGTGGPA